ncbi:MAG TPA: ubiquinone/menaquinone biosynthesis methyltransferase [Spirochaetia bacterium]|nr:ubiquinone/menaquinone biosynthesis methyltransferase [Spirochaetia bacterium]
MSRTTSLLSPSRGIARLFFAGREQAVGPARVGAFLEESQLRRMFQAIGGTYDLQNRILSLGRDAGWRKTLTERVRGRDGETVVDMATGTGEIAIAVARRYPGVRVIGVDFSQRMLREARRKVDALPLETGRRVELRNGDIRRTAIGSSTADVVTNVFALRNIPERAPVLAEFRRVLKPGGRLFIMETTVPSTPAVQLLYGAWLSVIMPFLGNVLSRTDYAYSYLKHSIESFPETPQFLRELAAAGFIRPRATPLSFGIAVLFSAIRGDG